MLGSRRLARPWFVCLVITVECALSGLLGLYVGLDYLSRLPFLGNWNGGYDVVHALTGEARATDLLQDYGGARALLFGGNAYEPTGVLAARYVDVGTTYLSYVSAHPPTAFALLLPVAALPFGAASSVWALLMLVGIVLSIRVFGAPWYVAVLLGPLVILLPPVAAGIGQLAVVWAVLAILAFRFRKRPFVAGVLIGIASLTKYLPCMLLVVFLVQRQWSALAGFALVWAMVLPLVAALNADALPTYLKLVGSVSSAWATEPGNGAFLLVPWLLRLGPLGLLLPVSLVLWVVWVDLWELRRNPDAEAGRWARWNWLSVALLPIAWSYSVVVLALSVALLFSQRRLAALAIALAGFVPVLISVDLAPGLSPFLCIVCVGVALILGADKEQLPALRSMGRRVDGAGVRSSRPDR